MKGITEYINENLGVGLMNHYTPILNIITNVKNLYGHLLHVLVLPTEDNTGLIIRSSMFTSEEIARNTMYSNPYANSYSSTLANYIYLQGLTEMKTVLRPDGTYDVYFVPTDLYNQNYYGCCPTEED